MNSNIIEIDHLEKWYGKNKVLDIESFNFIKGDSYLLIGINGAGKSTLIKLIINLINETKGSIKVNTKKIGYVPEKFTFPENITVYEFLNNLCNVRGYINYKKQIEKLLNWWGIDGSKLIRTLSKGMKQKVLIMQSIIIEEDLYIFDEALNGLDNVSQNDFLGILKRLIELGKTIIVCTHYDKYYSSFFNKAIYINGGKIIEVKELN